ncbi:MAG: lysophospholipid acyltransferase family protein [Calditrichota bacterium]
MKTASFAHRREYLLLEFIALGFRRLPLSWARRFAAAVAWLASDLIKLRRRVAIDNLKRAYPKSQLSDLSKIYRHCWRHFLQVGAEMARLPDITEEFIQEWVDLSQRSVLTRILEQGRGCLVVSGHFGNWEWMGGSMSRLGYPVSYVVTSQSNPLVEAWLDRMRKAAGIEIIPKREAVKGVLQALKRNRVVSIMCDQDAGEAGVFTPFFGRPASTPRGPALFYLKTQVPIVFAAAPRESDGKYHVIIERLEFSNLPENREEQEAEIMRRITARLEQEIRRHPEQWLWLHRRWKTQPPNLS